MNRIYVAAVAAVIALNACSGGKGGGNAPPATHAISGGVNGAVTAGVTVSLSGAATATTTTDASGNYSFPGLANGDYVVVANMTGYAFTPVSIAVKLNGADVPGQDFTAMAAANTYSISGRVSGAVAAGVTITLDGANVGSTITAADGAYSFAGLTSGVYTLTPTLAGYTFSPPSISVTVTVADQPGRDFTASAIPSTFAISGTVRGAVTLGVTMSLSGAATATTTTDASGNYSFPGLANGDFVVTPSMNGFAFTPLSIAVTVNGADMTGQDFTATAAATTFAISGTVRDVGGGGLAGVTVTLGGSNTGTATTDTNGNYSFASLTNGSYTLTPSLQGFTFNPTQITQVNVSGADVPGQDFVATAVPGTYTISGTVTGDVTAGVTIALGGDATATTTTLADGSYSFTGLSSGGYTVTPNAMGFVTFSPPSITVTVNNADMAGQDFISTLAPLPLTIITSFLPGGRVGQAYSAAIYAAGGTPAYAFTAVGLPGWLTLSTDGTLSGTPDAVGKYTFTVTVTDANGGTASRDLSVTVRQH